MPFFLAISGYHRAGKTFLGTYLVKNLSSLGYKIGVVKSCHQELILTDIEGKDTWQYRESGALTTGLLQKDLLTLYFRKKDTYKGYYNFFLSLFWFYDLVIFEGFKSFDLLPKLWITSSEKEKKEVLKVKSEIKNILGFVVKKENTKKWIQKEIPNYKAFLFSEKEEILSFVKNLLNSKDQILLKVNGKRIPLKEFVEDVLKYPVLGFIKALKGVPEDIKEVEIKIKLVDGK